MKKPNKFLNYLSKFREFDNTLVESIDQSFRAIFEATTFTIEDAREKMKFFLKSFFSTAEIKMSDKAPSTNSVIAKAKVFDSAGMSFYTITIMVFKSSIQEHESSWNGTIKLAFDRGLQYASDSVLVKIMNDFNKAREVSGVDLNFLFNAFGNFLTSFTKELRTSAVEDDKKFGFFNANEIILESYESDNMNNDDQETYLNDKPRQSQKLSKIDELGLSELKKQDWNIRYVPNVPKTIMP